VNLNPWALFPLILAIAAVVWLVVHWRTWRRYKTSSEDAAERDYRRRQFRRRMQATSLLAVIAVGMVIGVAIPWRQWSSVSAYVFWWTGISILVVWLIALALADALSSGLYFNKVKQERATTEARLRSELKRLKARGRNGRA
jgi:magnesium-transporting ATPase (P-type)